MALPGGGQELQRQRLSQRRALTAAGLLVAGLALGALQLGGDGRAVSFSGDVQPLLERKCVSCHPVSYPYLDLRRGRSYEQLVRVSAATAPAFERVLPGRPELSYILTHPPDPSLRDLLTEPERELLVAWIRAGAHDD